MARLDHPELLNSVLQLPTDDGSDAFADSLRILVDEAMFAERSAVLGAQPFERTEARKGYANGFKAKNLNTRLGPITSKGANATWSQASSPNVFGNCVETARKSQMSVAEADWMKEARVSAMNGGRIFMSAKSPRESLLERAKAEWAIFREALHVRRSARFFVTLPQVLLGNAVLAELYFAKMEAAHITWDCVPPLTMKGCLTVQMSFVGRTERPGLGGG